MSATTGPTDASVPDFLAAIGDEQQRADAHELDLILQRVTGTKPVMWGSAIVGYGTTEITYANGRTAEWMAVGFSPRSKKLVVYGLDDVEGRAELLDRLGKHSAGKGCLNVPKLAGIDVAVLEELVRRATS